VIFCKFPQHVSLKKLLSVSAMKRTDQGFRFEVRGRKTAGGHGGARPTTVADVSRADSILRLRCCRDAWHFSTLRQIKQNAKRCKCSKEKMKPSSRITISSRLSIVVLLLGVTTQHAQTVTPKSISKSSQLRLVRVYFPVEPPTSGPELKPLQRRVDAKSPLRPAIEALIAGRPRQKRSRVMWA
jgi:hypothetical protein